MGLTGRTCSHDTLHGGGKVMGTIHRIAGYSYRQRLTPRRSQVDGAHLECDRIDAAVAADERLALIGALIGVSP